MRTSTARPRRRTACRVPAHCRCCWGTCKSLGSCQHLNQAKHPSHRSPLRPQSPEMSKAIQHGHSGTAIRRPAQRAPPPPGGQSQRPRCAQSSRLEHSRTWASPSRTRSFTSPCLHQPLLRVPPAAPRRCRGAWDPRSVSCRRPWRPEGEETVEPQVQDGRAQGGEVQTSQSPPLIWPAHHPPE